MSLITGIIKQVRSNLLLLLAFASLVLIAGCGNKPGAKDDDDESSSKVTGKIEVQVTPIRIGTISQAENLNATTVYQLNDIVRAPISGYIRKMNVTPGQSVKEGDILFSMQTKEAAAMGAIKDTLFGTKGTILVKATEAGIVKSINRQLGDYVQDGDELCTIANNASLVFELDVPFEIRHYIKEGTSYTITLPDGSSVQTHITSQVPGMDKAVQMEKFILRSSSTLNLPEGLIGTVRIPTVTQTKATILPKAAVLSNETQTEFWVMKLVHDSTAIKVDIEKGLETKDSVQVTSPVFSDKDKILISGNYGLPDTVLVKVSNGKE
jgi:biotin carboxyl carrier protein